ncbi:hypothetical protein PG991_007095 [Apiospora marii]|uniref:Heterokaryon incompatibility domain-containing protein n=1 Tax=Apiospora marii TaxID=335849 RepID=A0ABR1RSF8_9PEZI
MSREEVKKMFLKGAQRYNTLNRHGLLYEYTPIQHNQMRLLYINPAGNYKDDLHVTMRTHMDEDVGPQPSQQAYEALSYHWGPGPADRPIYFAAPQKVPKLDFLDAVQLMENVDDAIKGTRFYIRPNLDKALRSLRDKTHVTVLWVDAVCINQSDELFEKPAQIAKMKHIYRKALNVCIWLGDGKGDANGDRSEDFYAAMDFVQKIVDDLKNFEFYLSERLTNRWSDLLDLMRCSWFSRRWVIQELALAREATVHCGTHFIAWADFADAIGLFAYNSDRIRALFRQSDNDKIYRNYKYLNDLQPLGAKILVEAITNTFRKSVDGDVFEPVFSLEALVCDLTPFESGDPRDSIFALLNIARESMLPTGQRVDTVGPPKPNYGRNILEVYTDFLEWVVLSTGSLDVICRQWATPERKTEGGRKNPTALVTLPSWIQTIQKSPWGTQEQGFNGRVNGDSFVGKAGRSCYNACHGKAPSVRFGIRWRQPIEPLQSRVSSAPTTFGADSQVSGTPTKNHFPVGRSTPAHRLHVKGIVIDVLHWVCGPVSMGVITRECLEKGGWNFEQEPAEKVPERLWRTMVADRDADGKNTPPWYHRAALHCMALADNNGHIGTSDLLEQGASHPKLPEILIEYLKRVQAVTWNRKFIEGAPVGRPGSGGSLEPLFGLGPPETQVGDRIGILFGCSVPCILRPRKDFYEFIGEAYVYGRMDGEAINMLSAAELADKTEEFIIV